MSLNKVNIQEANTHLRQLYKKVCELENKIQMQAMNMEELQKTNLQLQKQLHQVSQKNAKELNEKDSTITELKKQLEESEKRVQQLLESAQERDSTVLKLEKKARLFYEVIEHRSSIERILEVLNELSIPQEEESGLGSTNGEIAMKPELSEKESVLLNRIGDIENDDETTTESDNTDCL